MDGGSEEVFVNKRCLGRTLAADVYNSNEVVIVPKHTLINEYILSGLLEYGVSKVSVFRMGINLQVEREKDALEQKLDRIAQRSADESFQRLKKEYVEHVSIIKNVLNDLAVGRKLDHGKIDTLSTSLYERVNDYSTMIDAIDLLRPLDEYTYTHSVNVAIYGMLIAKWSKLSEGQCKDVIRSGLLHDIGKSRIPEKILHKKGRLSPREFVVMRRHTIIGYDIAGAANIKKDIRDAVLMHHERVDGTGYPFGITGDKIGLYSKIVSMSDVYDALTSERVYKRRSTPFDTIKMIQSFGYGTFDTRVMLTFLGNIASYYIGSPVQLNTGEVGEVVFVPPQTASDPIVRVKERFIDLAREKDYRIVSML